MEVRIKKEVITMTDEEYFDPSFIDVHYLERSVRFNEDNI